MLRHLTRAVEQEPGRRFRAPLATILTKRLLAPAAALAATLMLSGCEELFFEPEPGTTPTEIFDQVWTFVDEEYSFFDYKNIDWPAEREIYEPQVRNDMSDEALFEVLSDMLFQLRDGHVNLVSGFDQSRNWQWYLEEPPNYDYSVLLREYLENRHQYVGSFIVHEFRDPGAPDTEAVGYVHYRSFGSAVSPDDMSYIIDKFEPYKGLIIDVRGNGGGSSGNVSAIANRLTDRPVIVAHSQRKIGPGHDEFAEPTDVYLQPPSGASTYTKPIVVLTNRMCYSATNMFVAYVKSLDHVTVIGRRTGGGGGTPAYTLLSNNWQLRVSATRRFLPDRGIGLSMRERNIEGGVDPDIFEESPESELGAGTDRILETAISYVQSL